MFREQFEHQNLANSIEYERFELKNAANTLQMALFSSTKLQIARKMDRTGNHQKTQQNIPKQFRTHNPFEIDSELF